MANDNTGDYESWAAAGKPTGAAWNNWSGINAPVSKEIDPKWKTIQAKSTKVAKKTGTSPLQDALKKAVDAAKTEADKHATDAFIQTTKGENAAAALSNKMANSKAFVGMRVLDMINQQAKQALNNAGVPKAQAPSPTGVVGAQGQTPTPSSKVTVSGETGAQTGTIAPVKLGPPGGSATSQLPLNATQAQKDAAHVQDLQQQLAQATTNKETAAKVPSHKGSFFGNILSDVTGAVGTAADTALKPVGNALSYINRVTAAPVENLAMNLVSRGEGTLQQGIANVRQGGLSAVQPNLTPSFQSSHPVVSNPEATGTESLLSSVVKGVQGKEAVPGYDIAQKLGIHNKYLAGVVGFGLDVGLDPTTYLDLGLGTAVKNVVRGPVPQAAVDIERQALKSAAKAASEHLASATAIKAATKKGTKETARLAASGGAIGPTVTETSDFANHIYSDLIKQGAHPADALTATKVAVVKKTLADDAQQIYQTKLAKLTAENKAHVNVNFAGHAVPGLNKPTEKILDAVHAAKGKIVDTKLGAGVEKMFNTNYWFPGKTHQLFNIAKDTGVVQGEQKIKEINQAFKGLTRDEKIYLADSTEHGLKLSGTTKHGKDWATVQKFFEDGRDAQFQIKSDVLGKLGPGDYNSRYVHHYYQKQGGDATDQAIKDFNGARKARLQQNAPELLTLQDAADRGLKPIREADRIMMAEYASTANAVVRDAFNRKVFGTYGVVTDNPIWAQQQGLVKVNKLPRGMQIAKGHDMYLSPDIKRVLDHTQEFMTGGRNVNNRAALQLYDKVLHQWKFFNTAANPGHHIRNMIGDMHLNYIDGVRTPQPYALSARILSGRSLDKVRIKVGQQVLDGQQILDLFYKSGANPGFFASDLGRMGAKHMVGKLENKIYSASEQREVFGRLAHFIDSMQKEGADLGPKNLVGLKKASYAAGARINHWNIDYADKTPFERNVMQRVMPFYTWMRKATPLMVEAAATRPGKVTIVNKVNRLVENLAGTDPSHEMDAHPYPQWLNQLGFARVTGGDEPTVWSAPVPTNMLSDYFGGGTKDLFNKLIAQTTPAAQIPIELATGKSLNTGAKIATDVQSYAPSQMAAWSTAQAALGQGKYADPVSRIQQLSGIGLYKDTYNRQAGEVQRRLDQLALSSKELKQRMGNYEIHKVKNGYVIYDKSAKIQVTPPVPTQEELIPQAIKMAQGDPRK